MIKFIDLKDGSLYNGFKPYTHWFPEQQSTDLIYTHKICFLSDLSTIEVSLDSNVFNIIDSELLSSTTIKYKDVICQEIVLKGIEIDHGYLYMLYLSASSKNAGEYTTDIILNNEYTITVGADFYSENESLYINLSNMGLDLPAAIQKALYEVDIKEAARDNITMNRKIKELISNYWDVLANKGNYKSLINSLKWFEWGDYVRLNEVWKHNDFGDIVYDTRDLCSLLEDKYNDFYNGFGKTTYLALYMSMQNMGIGEEWDEECNPVLHDIVSKWGREDLILKMCMLGNFYETYFMPIHLDLIHATIENVVFSNTIKIISGNTLSRNDYFYQIGSIKCNIKDNQQFVLNNVKCMVGPDTIFGTNWNDKCIMGVDKEVIFNNTPISDDQLKTFYSQLYEGIGVVIPFECEIMVDPGDFVIESYLRINDNYTKDYHIYKDENGIIKISFNILLESEGSYEINMQFKTAGANIYSKQININVMDISNMHINVYKVKHLLNTGIDMGDKIGINKYKFSRCRIGSDHQPIVQYINSLPNNTGGIALNNILVLEGDYLGHSGLNNNYYITTRNTNNGIYTVCISKKYLIDPSRYPFYDDIKKYIYRNDYGYFPEFHYLEPLDGCKESDYNIYNNDVVAVVPELPYGLDVDGMDWEFVNTTTGKSYKFPYISEPYVLSDKPTGLEKGYYDIIFKFRVSDKWHMMKMDSAFRKV